MHKNIVFRESTHLGSNSSSSYDIQGNLELFYYSIPPKYRGTMPYEYRDEFHPNLIDYNDQFVFFMLAFFDKDIIKTEVQKIDLGLSALGALLEINHAKWIDSSSIGKIKEELIGIFKTKNYEEILMIFENHIPNERKRVNLMTLLRVTALIPPKYTKGF